MKKLFFILLATLAMTAVAQDKKVAILETVDREGKVSYAHKLMLRASLAKAVTEAEGYEAYDRVDTAGIFDELHFQRTGVVSDAEIRQLGAMSGAQYVMIAEAAMVDDGTMFITAKIIDVETAKTIKTDNQLMSATPEDIQRGCTEMASKLLNVKLEAGITRHTTPTIPTATTTSTQSATQKPAANTSEYVDLGLPSGTLWKNKNEDCGLITYDRAVSFYKNKLPTAEQMQELVNSCMWKRRGRNYEVIGPSGKSIILPMETILFCGGNVPSPTADPYGRYWTSTAWSESAAYCLLLNTTNQEVWFGGDRCEKYSVRLVQSK